jgi:hypothetical protein
MFRSVGDAFTKIAYHMDENDRVRFRFMHSLRAFESVLF